MGVRRDATGSRQRTHEQRADEHVEAVVVGSGFGGSVAAYRLASDGRSVVVLERGKPYPPGSFPRSPAGVARNFWDPSAGLHGLFDIWSFRGLEGVVSSGLGGGSLIYANVLLRKEEDEFVTSSPIPGGGYEHWPFGRADLDPHYDAVEAMLGATPYPYADTTLKTQAVRESAERLGLDWSLPPLAVSFAPRPGADASPSVPLPTPTFGNVHGRGRATCRLCGECDLGCNDGAKNTLDHTYLSAAQSAGADLRTRCEVRGIAPREGGGYEVRYVEHDPAAEGSPTDTRRLPLRRITCDRLVLAAGTFGTTYLLLRSRAAFPGMSAALGTRFSGNGDLLGFLLGARAQDGTHRPLEAARGPVITSAIRVPGTAGGSSAADRGYYVEDAGYPAFADWLVESSQVPGALRRTARFAAAQLLARLRGTGVSNVSAQVSAMLGRAEMSDGSLPLLGMGRDVPDGRMRLRKGSLDIDWTTATSQDFFERMRGTMRAVADDLGAGFRDNPLWWGKRVVTVHPLGGAPVGRHRDVAVCDGFGEVFGFPGLHVLDGAAMPGPVGANPSLTIAAMADRACDHILEAPRTRARQPVQVPAQATPVEPPADAAPRSPDATSLSFTEEMKGFVTLDVTDPVEGERLGRQRGQRLMFRLTITADDVDAFVRDSEHLGSAVGYVECDLLGGRLPVERGWFNLFTQEGDAASRRMHYRLHFSDTAGTPLTLVGHKEVEDDRGLDVWRDTSTLYVTVQSGHVSPGEEPGRIVAAGILTIHVPDFLQQLTTFRADGPDPVGAMHAFGALFLGELWQVYGPRLEGARS